MIKLSKEEAQLLSKKLEYRFKNSGNVIVEKLSTAKKEIELTPEEITLVKSKLEYRFKNSDSDLLKKLK